MPPKGYKKLNGGRSRPRANLTLSQQCHDLLEAIAIDEHLINPRTLAPNKSKAVEVAALAYRIFRCNYPNDMPSEVLTQPKLTDCWYTPVLIINLVAQVVGQIDLDPCADDAKHVPAHRHFTSLEDGLNQKWEGRVFMNPPYSCPGVWMKKLRDEVELGRVREAVALVPAATDTNWLNPVLHTQCVCFWKGRIKFLDINYQPRLSARQSHVLVYWGGNQGRFKEVFKGHGFVSLPDRCDAKK